MPKALVAFALAYPVIELGITQRCSSTVAGTPDRRRPRIGLLLSRPHMCVTTNPARPLGRRGGPGVTQGSTNTPQLVGPAEGDVLGVRMPPLKDALDDRRGAGSPNWGVRRRGFSAPQTLSSPRALDSE